MGVEGSGELDGQAALQGDHIKATREWEEAKITKQRKHHSYKTFY